MPFAPQVCVRIVILELSHQRALAEPAANSTFRKRRANGTVAAAIRPSSFNASDRGLVR